MGCLVESYRLFVVVLFASGVAIAGGVSGGEVSNHIESPEEPLETGFDSHGTLQQATAPSIQTKYEETNESIRHRHVDDVDESGSEESLEDWLSEQVTDSVTRSAELLQEGEHEQAEALLDEEFDRYLEQYREVSGEEAEVRDLARVAGDQRELVNLIEQYEQTYEEYQEAREAGDDDRARELARELESIEHEIDEHTVQTLESQQTVSETTDRDFGEESETIVDVRNDISERQESVRDTEFERTTIDATVNSPDASFRDPLVIEGQVSTEAGTAPSNGTVQVQIQNRTVSTPIDEDGTFTLEYRPALLDEDADSVTVEYVPEVGSEYINSTTDVPINVTPVEPEIEITEHPESTAYEENVTVAGNVHVDDVPADQVPVNASIGGQQIGEQVETNDEGEFVVQGLTPAEVPTGEQDVTVTTPETEQALSASAGSESVSIEETETVLEFEVEQGPDDNAAGDRAPLEVSGTLMTTLEDPLESQSVTILLDGEAVTAGETDESGEFEETVEIDEEVDSDQQVVEVAVAYEDETTNLEDNRGEVTVDLRPITERFVPFGSSPLWWIFGGITLVLGVGLAIVVANGSISLPWRSDSESTNRAPSIGLRLLGLEVLSDGTEVDFDPAVAPDEEEPVVPGNVTRQLSESSPETANVPVPGSLAKDRLAAGDTDGAVILGYEIARAYMNQETPPDHVQTPWEFYRDRAETHPEEADALRRLTNAYEQAAFAPISLPYEESEGAIELASDLATGTDSTGPQTHLSNGGSL